MNSITRIKHFARKEPVLAVSAILAVVSMFFVPPDAQYIQYIDFKTLFCLFCLMVSLKGIEREGLIHSIAVKLSAQVNSLRYLGFLLVFLSFVASMFMTNDVALIALVPITLAVLSLCKLTRHTACLVVLQTLAANIGSSLTPIGNPQNLFLFSRYGFTLKDFLTIMFPFVLFGGALLAMVCLFLPRQSIGRETISLSPIRKTHLLLYGALFLVAIAAVFGMLPYLIAAPIIVVSVMLIDRQTLAKVDYSLLLTFVAVFILVGNISRIDAINRFLSGWVQKDTMMTAILSSQFISNVPAAVMLSGFTENAKGLLVGVNVGGMGTLIASMASVISYKLYAVSDKGGALRYLGMFTALNIAFLLLSIGFVRLIA